MHKSPVNYKEGQCLKELDTGSIYQIKMGGIAGVWIKKHSLDCYLSAREIQDYYTIWDLEAEDRQRHLINNFKKYYNLNG